MKNNDVTGDPYHGGHAINNDPIITVLRKMLKINVKVFISRLLRKYNNKIRGQ